MKRVVLVLGAVLVLLSIAVFVDNSSALAVGNPVPCESFGGVWTQIDVNHAKCTFSPDNIWSQIYCHASDAGAVDYLYFDGINWNLSKQICTVGGFLRPSSSTAVVAGSPVDAWNGNCGAYISNPPWNGSVEITKSVQQDYPNFLGVCHVEYYDYTGAQLKNFLSPGWVYVNLNGTSAYLWKKGKLNFYLYQNGSWQTCSNTYFVDAGEHGRLSCYSSNPVSFGIGTGIASRPLEAPGSYHP